MNDLELGMVASAAAASSWLKFLSQQLFIRGSQMEESEGESGGRGIGFIDPLKE
jgi:hypothetical protein